jgi:Protein of unknown function (DUF3182)
MICFGGVVPHLFAKTKAITHRLVADGAARPDGWSPAFAEKVGDVVLPGFTVFTADDARIAATRMLELGGFRVIRVKEPLHAGGEGQSRVSKAEELDAVLDTLAEEEMTTCGLVLEADLRDVRLGTAPIDVPRRLHEQARQRSAAAATA